MDLSKKYLMTTDTTQKKNKKVECRSKGPIFVCFSGHLVGSCSCVVVYRRSIAQCRLRSVGFTTSCKNISSEYLRVEKFKRGASVAQPIATLSAARQHLVGKLGQWP